jgi:predicted glycosyltransferase
MDAEMDSIRCKEDMVSLHNGREFVNFDASVETVIGQLDQMLQKMFKTTTPPLLVCSQSFVGLSNELIDGIEILPNPRSPGENI